MEGVFVNRANVRIDKLGAGCRCVRGKNGGDGGIGWYRYKCFMILNSGGILFNDARRVATSFGPEHRTD